MHIIMDITYHVYAQLWLEHLYIVSYKVIIRKKHECSFHDDCCGWLTFRQSVARQLLLDEEGNLKKLGEVIKNPELAATLEKIRDNPNSFYNGSLAEDIAKDMEANQGIITSDDLQNYQAQTDKVPVEGQLGDWTWYTTPPPSSGLVLTMILNILKGMVTKFPPGYTALWVIITSRASHFLGNRSVLCHVVRRLVRANWAKGRNVSYQRFPRRSLTLINF